MTTLINKWPKDKQIERILQKTLKETVLNVKEINVDLLRTILDSSYNPVFTGTLWKLLKYVDENIKHADHLFWIPSGNTIGYLKYNGHIPWDDDIDIGFKIINNYDIYVSFLIECIKKGLIVNLHIKKVDNNNLNWYENDTVVNLIFDHVANPSWNFMKESDFRNLLKSTPNKFHFASVTLHEFHWKKICTKLDFTGAYMWNSKSIVTPWIDVIPFIKKDNKYVPQVTDNKNPTPDISLEMEHHRFLCVPGRYPNNLLSAILSQYNEGRTFINFLHWDTIYSHVKNNKVIIDYNKEPELHKFVRAYVIKYNEALLYYMHQVNYADFFN